MDTVILGYNVLTLEDCEDNWAAAAGATSADADTSDYQRGAASIKIVVPVGTGTNANLAYEDAGANADLTSYDSVALWAKSSVALNASDMSFVLDNDTGLASIDKTLTFPALSANVWTRVSWTGQSLSAVTSLSSLGIRQVVDVGAFNLWIDDVIVFNSKSFNILAQRGIDDAEDLYHWPALDNTLLDGSSDYKVSRFGRNVTLGLHVISAKADRLWLAKALMSSSVRIIYASDEVEGVIPPGGHALNWVGGLDNVHNVTLQFREKTPLWSQTKTPPSWSV